MCLSSSSMHKIIAKKPFFHHEYSLKQTIRPIKKFGETSPSWWIYVLKEKVILQSCLKKLRLFSQSLQKLHIHVIYSHLICYGAILLKEQVYYGNVPQSIINAKNKINMKEFHHQFRYSYNIHKRAETAIVISMMMMITY